MRNIKFFALCFISGFAFSAAIAHAQSDDFGKRFDNNGAPGFSDPASPTQPWDIEPATGAPSYDYNARERFEDTLPSSDLIDESNEESFEDVGARYSKEKSMDKSNLYDIEVGP